MEKLRSENSIQVKNNPGGNFFPFFFLVLVNFDVLHKTTQGEGSCGEGTETRVGVSLALPRKEPVVELEP